MTLILDTSIILDIERGYKPTLTRLRELRKRFSGKPNIAYMTYVELLYGIEGKVKNKEESLDALSLYHLLLPTRREASLFAQLKRKYDRKGKKMPLADLFIATQVRAVNGVLITKDAVFKEIDDVECIVLS